jgi:hypothetical protein
MNRATVVLAFMLGMAIGACAMYAGFSKPAAAQVVPIGMFQIVASSDGEQTYRLNTVTGELVHCWILGALACNKMPTP